MNNKFLVAAAGVLLFVFLPCIIYLRQPEVAPPMPIDCTASITTSTDTPPEPAGPVHTPEPTADNSGVIKGTIIGPDSRAPVSGANILVEYIARPNAFSPYPKEHTQWTATSDEAGHFRVGGLPISHGDPAAESRFLLIASTGHESSTRRIILTANDSLFSDVYTLYPTDRIEGQIVDTHGRPVANAVVKPLRMALYEGRRGSHGMSENWTHTTEDGRFTLKNLNVGSWRLTVSAPDLAPSITAPIETGTSNVRIPLARGQHITGLVVEETWARPVGNLDLVISPVDKPGDPVLIQTDAQGAFQTTGLAEGSYTVTARLARKHILSPHAHFTVPLPKDRPTLQLVVGDRLHISGWAVHADTGQPIEAMAMEARSTGRSPRASYYGTTDSTGHFDITDLPPGTFTVAPAAGTKYSPRDEGAIKTVALREGSPVEGLRLQVVDALSVTGRILDEKGHPVGDLTIIGNSHKPTTLRQRTATGEDGRFHLSGFAPNAEVHLEFFGHDYVPPHLDPILLEDKDPDPLTIGVSKGAALGGHVVDDYGSPLRNIRVSVLSESKNTQTDLEPWPSGRFRFSALPADTYRIIMTREGDYENPLRHDTPITLSRGQVVQDFQAIYTKDTGPVISGRIMDDNGKSVRRATIQAIPSGNYNRPYARSDDSGNYEIPVYRDLVYTLRVTHDNFMQQQIPHVRPDTRNKDVALREPAILQGKVIDSRTKRPVTRFEIAHNKYGRDQREAFVATHDDGGRFRLDTIVTPETMLAVSAKGYAPLLQEVRGITGEAIRGGITLALDPGASIEGRVVNHAGAPVAGADISLGYGDPRREKPRPVIPAHTTLAVSDSKGFFRIDSLPTDIKEATVSHTDYAPLTIKTLLIAGQATPLKFILEPENLPSPTAG